MPMRFMNDFTEEGDFGILLPSPGAYTDPDFPTLASGSPGIDRIPSFMCPFVADFASRGVYRIGIYPLRERYGFPSDGSHIHELSRAKPKKQAWSFELDLKRYGNYPALIASAVGLSDGPKAGRTEHGVFHPKSGGSISVEGITKVYDDVEFFNQGVETVNGHPCLKLHGFTNVNGSLSGPRLGMSRNITTDTLSPGLGSIGPLAFYCQQRGIDYSKAVGKYCEFMDLSPLNQTGFSDLSGTKCWGGLAGSIYYFVTEINFSGRVDSHNSSFSYKMFVWDAGHGVGGRFDVQYDFNIVRLAITSDPPTGLVYPLGDIGLRVTRNVTRRRMTVINSETLANYGELSTAGFPSGFMGDVAESAAELTVTSNIVLGLTYPHSLDTGLDSSASSGELARFIRQRCFPGTSAQFSSVLPAIRAVGFKAVSDAFEQGLSIVKSDFVETLAEINEVFDFMGLGEIGLKFLDIKNKDKGITRRGMIADGQWLDDLRDWFTSGKIEAGRDLTTKFGINPLVQAGKDLNEILNRPNSPLKSTYRFFHGKASFDIPEHVFDVAGARLECRAKVNIYVPTEGLLATILASHKNGILPTMARLWDTYPGSWFVDWFTNMSETLNVFDNSVVLFACKISYVTYSYTVTIPITQKVLDGYGLHAGMSEPYIHLYCREYSQVFPTFRPQEVFPAIHFVRIPWDIVGDLLTVSTN